MCFSPLLKKKQKTKKNSHETRRRAQPCVKVSCFYSEVWFFVHFIHLNYKKVPASALNSVHFVMDTAVTIDPSHNVNESEKLFVHLPHELDQLQHLMGPSLAHTTPVR